MAIKNIQETELLKKYGKRLGRKGVALRIIELCKEVAQEEHYKNSIVACGKIKALFEACKYDSYWKEKSLIGFYSELRKAANETIED